MTKLKFKMLNRSSSIDLPLDLSINKLNQNKSNLFKPYSDCNSYYKIKSNQVKSTLLNNQLMVNELITNGLINFPTNPLDHKLTSFYSNLTSSLSNYPSIYSSPFLNNNLNNSTTFTSLINDIDCQRSPSYSPNSTFSSNSNNSLATANSFFSSNSIEFNYKPLELANNQPIDLSKPQIKNEKPKNKEINKLTNHFKLNKSPTSRPKVKKPRLLTSSLKLLKKENNENQILIKCPSCWQLFDQENSLRKHIKSKHQFNDTSTSSFDRIHKCEHCVLAFTRFDMLQRHNRKHTGEKPYECNLCFRNFSRSDHLNTHRINHFGLKPYICNICPYASSRRDMVSRHLQTHSKSTGAYVKTDLIAKQLCRKLVHTHPDQIPGLIDKFKAEC